VICNRPGVANRMADNLRLAMARATYEVIDSSDGARIVLHHLGGPGGKEITPVLLFSHATGFHGRVWEPMASHLTDRFRCVSVDLRGHGLSRLPSEAGVAWSGMADDILATLSSEHFPVGPLHGIGHSMGGAALVLTAARRPAAFRSLWLYEPVIVPSEAGSLMDGDNPMSQAADRRRDRFDSLTHAYENYRSKPPLNQLHPDALRAYVDGGFSPSPDGSVTLRCRPSIEAEVFRHAATSGAWNSMATVGIPVAVVAGRPEEVGPGAFAPAIANALAAGTFIERPHLGHFGPLEDPAAMAAEVSAWVLAHP
jgi:pimeloyl-ACP methyl ester carboxylesterase